jgi:hypothetical protein
MNKASIFIALLTLYLLTGCEETKSVEWWIEHHEEALKKEVECKKTGSDSQNCQNVKQANFEYQQLHPKTHNDLDRVKKSLGIKN